MYKFKPLGRNPFTKWVFSEIYGKLLAQINASKYNNFFLAKIDNLNEKWHFLVRIVIFWYNWILSGPKEEWGRSRFH